MFPNRFPEILPSSLLETDCCDCLMSKKRWSRIKSKCIALWATVFHAESVYFMTIWSRKSQLCTVYILQLSMSTAVIIHPEHSPGVWFRGDDRLSLSLLHTHTDVTDGLVNILLAFCSAVKHLMATCSHLAHTLRGVLFQLLGSIRTAGSLASRCPMMSAGIWTCTTAVWELWVNTHC